MKAVSGLDVHKDTIFACILKKGEDPFINEYNTLTCGIRQDISNYWNLVSKTYYSYKPSLIINSESEIKVFPNPFRDMLYIGLPEEPEYTLFELYDSAGRKIITSKENVIDLSFLAQGVYLIRVINKNGSLIKTMKVVKE